MKMKKRFLSILLSLVMVLGLLPGMSLTALADSTPKVITNGGSYYIGETITFTAPYPWVRYDDDTSVNYTAQLVSSENTTVPTPTYDSRCLQWKYTGVWKYNFNGFTSNVLRITGANAVTPIGFTCSGGTGTQTDPYIFAAIYPPHTHSFTYTAEGATITATCSEPGCDLNDNKVTLTIKAPENLYYNDTTASHAATLENLEAFNAATGKGFTQDSITYYKGDNQSSDIKNGSPRAATYTAKIAADGNLFGNKVASVTFTFTAKPVEHTHSFTYTANGAVITATCTQNASNMEACDLTNKQATLTLNAPLHTTYGDGKDANATLTGEIPGVTNPTIHYSKGSVTLSSAPTDAGTYTAWCQLGNATASVEYTIGKATNNGWTTLPQAINNLVYTGQPQDLITAGVPSAGNALYTVGTDPDNEPDDTAGGRPYTSSVPEMTNAGTYYVWCKIDGGKNYTSINAQKVEVTIARADITPSVSIVGWTYGQTANTPMVGDTDNPGIGEVTYTYKVKNADDSTYKSTVPTAAGNYTVKAVIAETANYNSGVATKDFTISKAALTVTAKDQNISVGDEVPDLSDPVLDTHYTVAGLVGTDTLTTAPTLAYQKNGNAATPDNTALGTYDIVASGASAGDNYTISYTNGTLTVEKGKAVAATVTANNRTYDGTEKPLVTVDNSTLVGGEMWYALGENATTAPADNLYTTSIRTKTDAGIYYIWYKVIGDANHTNTDPDSVTVTISPADKAALNAAIDSAAKYSDSIKDYAEIAATLNAAIDAARAVAANDNAAPDAIADAVTKLNTATETAKAAVEAAKNQAAAQKVTDAIMALPEPATLNDKAAVEAARKTYDALTEAQKALVPADTLKKLTDAEAAIAVAEKSAAEAEKDAAAAQKVTDAIKALPEPATLNDKAAVEAARKAYDALTDAQKALVPADVLKKLTDAEAAIAAAETISLRKCTITAQNRIYTGKAITPRVTVMYGDTKLKEGQDYTLSYKKVKQFQKVRVVVKGKGRFKGTRNAYFKIVPKGTAITKVSGGKKQFTVKWKKQKDITGFQIEYSLHSDFANSRRTYIRSDKTLSATIGKLKAGKTYYVRVRTYHKRNRRLFFSTWTEAVAVNTNGAKANEARVINIAVNVGDELDLNTLATGVTTWESSDEAVATVSAEGVAKALAAGEATFTGFDANGEEIKIVMQVSDSATLELEAIDLTDFGGGIVEDIDADEPLTTEEELELTLE